jgi:hypothetical protein
MATEGGGPPEEPEEADDGEERDERELDAQEKARRRVALAQIRQYPDAVLRMRANGSSSSTTTSPLADKMASIATLTASAGRDVQVGVLQRCSSFRRGMRRSHGDRRRRSPRPVESPSPTKGASRSGAFWFRSARGRRDGRVDSRARRLIELDEMDARVVQQRSTTSTAC